MENLKDRGDGFSYKNFDEARAFIQYKNTDICIDFHCECGAHCHFDGYFASAVKCPHCATIWEMPFNLFPRKADDKTDEFLRNNPVDLEPDEDFDYSDFSE